MSYWLELRVRSFKFSAAHMTVLGPGRKESLHGHNYTLDLSVHLAETPQELVSFQTIKECVYALCTLWDEKVLLATRNADWEDLSISPTSHEVEFRLCHKRYILPRDEVVLLPIVNVTVEALAAHALYELRMALERVLRPQVLIGLILQINESVEQGARVHWER